MGGKPIWGTLAQSGRSDGVRRTLWAERGVCWVGGGVDPGQQKGLVGSRTEQDTGVVEQRRGGGERQVHLEKDAGTRLLGSW